MLQIDTGKRDTLPHLGGSIENIVVSPQGASYAVHLDDNSTMILSSADRKPTAYISGIQSMAFSDSLPKDENVLRTWRPLTEFTKPLTALLSPTIPSRMLLGVGNGLQATLVGEMPSTSSMQTFDIASCQSVIKQPLARTNPTDINITKDGYPITEPTITHLCMTQSGKWLASVDVWEPPTRDIPSTLNEESIQKEYSKSHREIYLRFWEASKDDATFELMSRVHDAHVTSSTEAIFDIVADKRANRFITLGNDGMIRFWAPKAREHDGIISIRPDGRTLSNWSCTGTISLGESSQSQDEEIAFGLDETCRSGALAFSADGSTLFAAYGHRSEEFLYVLDPESGEIKKRIHGLFTGDVRKLGVLGASVIMLSEDLAVYDIVADELRYGVHLNQTSSHAAPLSHLAVDERSGTFAVAIPLTQQTHGKVVRATRSEIALFSPEQSAPLLVESFPDAIISLLPSTGSSGYVAVDSAAQVWSLGETSESTPLAQPLADLHLDKVEGPDVPQVVMANEEGDIGIDSDAGEDNGSEDDVEMEDFDIHEAVVAPQKLTEIFDAAPAFAMPPIEDLFYQVTSLFSAKPLDATPL